MATIPSLVFDTTYYSHSYGVSRAVNHVLSRHNGSIQVFELRGHCVAPNLIYWIFRVSKYPIKTLVLELWNDVQYKLPYLLFTCESLSCLKLMNCLLMPPPSSFKGFKNLTCLELVFVTLTNDALEKLVSTCPLLEKLTLSGIKEADSLEIDAPNLRDLSIRGKFVNITLGYAMTKLSVIYIRAAECVYPSLVDLFTKLPSIRRLQLDHCDLGFMYGDSTQDGFPFHCKDLYRLAIRMGFGFPMDHIPSTLYLCRDRREMEARRNYSYFAMELGTWEDDNGSWDYDFKRLRSVTMDNFRGTSMELEFAKYVLGNSPVLEEVIVNPSNEIAWRDVESVFELWRPPGAKVFWTGV